MTSKIVSVEQEIAHEEQGHDTLTNVYNNYYELDCRYIPL